MKTENRDRGLKEIKGQKQGSTVYAKSQDQEETDLPVKISGKDFIAACMAQYAILFPVAIGVWLVFFLLLLFITKVWFQ